MEIFLVEQQRRKKELQFYLQLIAGHPFICHGKDAKKLTESLLSMLPGSLHKHHCRFFFHFFSAFFLLLNPIRKAIGGMQETC